MDMIFSSMNLKNYLITLVVFLSIDMVWLLVISKNLYAKHLGYLMTPNVNVAAAFAFYLIFVAGILFFVINPALAKESFQYALFVGMFFGLITYATYDLSNLATVKDWPVLITAIDLVWGTCLSGATAAISYTVIRFLS